MAGRVFLRGIEGEKYELRAERQQRLQAERVVRSDHRPWDDKNAAGHEDSSPLSRTKWMAAPQDDPFLTQTVQCHFVLIEPGGFNGGHGHQKEAALYINEGRGDENPDRPPSSWSA